MNKCLQIPALVLMQSWIVKALWVLIFLWFEQHKSNKQYQKFMAAWHRFIESCSWLSYMWLVRQLRILQSRLSAEKWNFSVSDAFKHNFFLSFRGVFHLAIIVSRRGVSLRSQHRPPPPDRHKFTTHQLTDRSQHGLSSRQKVWEESEWGDWCIFFGIFWKTSKLILKRALLLWILRLHATNVVQQLLSDFHNPTKYTHNRPL